ncbi:MAG: hypothetical protein JNK82_06290 [Myxococcaceae bacterium]|nr:hypothetical protein [Myxococcaceae bacterium]
MLFVSALLFAAAAEPAPLPRALEVWAAASGFKLAPATECSTGEELHFGAAGSTCQAAKSTKPVKGSTDLFPRLRIIVSRYASEAAARERMKRFRETPGGARGELEKTWPLRGGFRLGDRVVLVTTDAFAFEGDVRVAAAALAKASGGTDLTCWAGAC